MLEPVQLPSGKIVDLSKCMAIVPVASSTDSQIILLGTEQQIQIDAVDLATLRQEIKQRQTQGKYQLDRKIKTPEAEDKDSADLARKLQDFNSRWEQLAADKNAKQESEVLQQILDAERPRGQKLYRAE
jgi:hypothetical protein